MTAAELGEVLGMTEAQVWYKASAMGLRKNRLLSAEARELLWEMREMEGAVEFFSREFGAGAPALERLLEQMKGAGGPELEAEPEEKREEIPV
jgi:hypothetical protein